MRFLQRAAVLTATLSLLAGCAAPQAPDASQDAAPSQTSAPAVSQTAAPDDALADAVARARETYRADAVFYDAVTPIKALLLGETQIVALTCVGGFEQTEALERAAVARVETSRLAAFAVVNIYDKTGKSLSITLSPTDADALAAELNG